jgi:hypothetical protein
MYPMLSCLCVLTFDYGLVQSGERQFAMKLIISPSSCSLLDFYSVYTASFSVEALLSSAK